MCLKNRYCKIKIAYANQDIVSVMEQKGIYKEILNLGIPSFLEALFNTFASIIDSKMVAVMGVSAISAVSVTNQPRLFAFSIFFALNTVTSSLIAKYYGKKDRDGANRIFDHMLKLVTILSIVMGILLVILARPIMILFSGQPDTMNDSVIYFRIVMGGMIFNLLFMEINAALRGYGKTKLTFASNVLSCVVNLFCNYLLIEGHWGFPALGMAGAAIATVLGTVAAFILCLVFAFRQNQFVNIPYCVRKRYHMTKESLQEIWTLTKSCVVDSISMRAALLVISGITARIGSFYMSVYAIGMYLLNFNYALGTGLQTSAVALIGRSYGEGSTEKVNRFKNAHIRLGLICSIVLGLIIVAGGKWFYGFFSNDPKFIATGAGSCALIGIASIAQTQKFVFNGCLLGVGAMREVMIASILGYSFINLGTVALTVLVLHWGIWGVWLSVILSQSVQAVVLFNFIRRNKAFSV